MANMQLLYYTLSRWPHGHAYAKKANLHATDTSHNWGIMIILLSYGVPFRRRSPFNSKYTVIDEVCNGHSSASPGSRRGCRLADLVSLCSLPGLGSAYRSCSFLVDAGYPDSLLPLLLYLPDSPFVCSRTTNFTLPEISLHRESTCPFTMEHRPRCH